VGVQLGEVSLSRAWEKPIEGYYTLSPVRYLQATAEFRAVRTPGMNAARGPIFLAGSGFTRSPEGRRPRSIEPAFDVLVGKASSQDSTGALPLVTSSPPIVRGGDSRFSVSGAL